MKTRRQARPMSDGLRIAAERVEMNVAGMIAGMFSRDISDTARNRWRELHSMKVGSPAALLTKVSALVDFAIAEFRSDDSDTIATVAELCAVRDGLRSAIEVYNA